jgi:hypothetical protein
LIPQIYRVQYPICDHWHYLNKPCSRCEEEEDQKDEKGERDDHEDKERKSGG